MNDFGDRLDRLSDESTNSIHLSDPSVGADTPAGVPRWIKLGGAVAVVALFVGVLALTRGGGEPAGQVVVADGAAAQNLPPLDTPGGVCTDPGVFAGVVELFRSGLPTYDYNPAGSFAALAENSEFVVSGTAVSVRRVVTDDTDPASTVVQVADVESVDGRPIQARSEFSYDSEWALGLGEDPLATPIVLPDKIRFIAFLVPDAQRREGFAPAVEGLYLACGDDTPTVAVIESAAGPDDPSNPTIEQLIDLVAGVGPPPAILDCASPRAIDEILARLVAVGVTVIDPLDSIATMSITSDAVLTGTIDHIRATERDPAGRGFIEVEFGETTAVGEPPSEPIDSAGYLQFPVESSQPSVDLVGLEFVAFFRQNSSLQSDWGITALYVACDRDTSEANLVTAISGAVAPAGATIAQIVELADLDAEQAAEAEAELLAQLEDRATESGYERGAVAIANELVVAARGDTEAFAAIEFADEVALALGDSVVRSAPGTSLRNVSGWQLDVATFEGRPGPFNALDWLGLPRALDFASDGFVPCTALPTLQHPPGFEAARLVIAQVPFTDSDSCSGWFGVYIYFDAEGTVIEGVALNLPTASGLESDEQLAGAEDIRDALVRFARGDQAAFDELPLADAVALGLHDEIIKTATKAELRDQAAWTVDRPEGYAESLGPFNVFDSLNFIPDTMVSIGPHPHCAGPPLDPPAGFENHTQVSIQAADGTIDSCIPWFAVDLWLNPETELVEAVTLGLFGP